MGTRTHLNSVVFENRRKREARNSGGFFHGDGKVWEFPFGDFCF